ncbi:MAG: DUF4920 domain-containing protein [Balneolaceae bacterium]|nr:DUF4920 domain-containing protein [Balneolaceae bacterium]
MRYAILTFVFLFGGITLSQAQDTQSQNSESQQEVIQLSDPVEQTDDYRVFGSAFEEEGEILAIDSVIASAEQYDGQRLKAEGTIKQVCQKKGCFFMLESEGVQARITFKDYGFFIPTNTAGLTVKVDGTFAVKELSEEQAKHYAEDAGEDADAISGPQQEYTLVATSVKIMDRPE